MDEHKRRKFLLLPTVHTYTLTLKTGKTQGAGNFELNFIQSPKHSGADGAETST